MPLSILIVGRGERPDEFGPNGHRFRFMRSSRFGSDIIPIEQFDFVFQHLGPANPEAASAISEWVDKNQRSRIIAFRGGAISEEWQARGIALMPDVGDIAALPWALVAQDFGGDAAELVRLLRPESLDLLPAIAILCQGYLAVYAAHHQHIQNDGVNDALTEMGWDYLKHISLVRENQANVQDAAWWLDVFELRADSIGITQAETVDPARWSDFVERLAAEWGKGGERFLKGNLMQVLGEGGAISDPKAVAEAYLEIARRLGGRRRQ